MRSRKFSISYIIFYILFSVDTWRLTIGALLASAFVSILALKTQFTFPEEVITWCMLTGIGWTVSIYPAQKVTRFLKNIILK